MFKAAFIIIVGVVAAQAAWAAEKAFRLSAGEGRVINLESEADTVLVANPAVADVSPISGRKLVLLGKAPGQTTLLVFDQAGRNVLDATLVVGPLTDRTVRLNRGTQESILLCSPECIGAGGGAPAAQAGAAEAREPARPGGPS